MAHKLPLNGTILGLDIGDKRIGLARANAVAKLPAPIETILNDENTVTNLEEIIHREDVNTLVVGIPRNMDGDETPQSAKIRKLADTIAQQISIEMVFVDESFSSVRADEYIAGFKKQGFSQDSIAACFILQEFFTIGVA